MRTEQFRAYFIIFITFIGMYLLNHWMPLHRDDYNYSMIWATTTHLASFSDVWTSLYRHYFLHGGRMTAFLVLDSFLLWGKAYFNFANAFAYTWLILLLYWHAVGRFTFSFRPLLLAGISLGAWFCYPHFGEVVVWMCGSTVYLWTTCIVGSFLLPYRIHSLRPKAVPNNALFAISMALLGIGTGWSLENTAVAAGLLTIYATYHAYRQGTLCSWHFTGLAGGTIGIIALLAAPGNWVRIAHTTDSIGKRIGNQIAGNGEMLLYLIPLILTCIIVYRILTRTRLQTLPRKDGVSYIIGIITATMAISYATNQFLGRALTQALFIGVAMPLGYGTEKILTRLQHVSSGFEEMGLYLLIMYYLYRLVQRRFAFAPPTPKSAREKVRTLASQYEPVRYFLLTVVVAMIANVSMLGAPTFPARASFFAVNALLAGTASLFTIPEVATAFRPHRQWFIRTAVLIMIPFYGMTAYYTYQVHHIDAARIHAVQAAAANHHTSVALEPIPFSQRIHRHLYYVDWDNRISRGGICDYYQLKDIHLIGIPNK